MLAAYDSFSSSKDQNAIKKMYIILLVEKKEAIFLSSEKQVSIPYSPVNGIVSQKQTWNKMTGVVTQKEERRTKSLHVNEND